MSKLAKVGLALGGTLVFVLVTLSILVKVMVTPEKVRETLLPMAEEALQRKVEIGKIDIGIFSGVSLSDLRVLKRGANDDFIFVQSMALDYKLLALLKGEVVIDQLLLEQPKIVVIRQADGRYNFSDLLAESKPENGSAAPTKQSEKDQPKGSAGSALDILVNTVSIKGGELLYIDRSQNSKSPYRYTLEQFDFQASKITLDKAFPITLSAVLNGSKIEVSGQYNIAQKSGDLDIKLAPLDLVQFAPYYRQVLPGRLGSAELALNLEVQMQPQLIESKGKVKLEKLELVLNDLPEAALQQTSLGFDYALGFDLSSNKLDVSTLLINFNDTVFGVDGTVNVGGSEPDLDLTIAFDKLDLRKLLQSLPAGLTKQLQSYSLAGQVDGRVGLAGRPSEGAALVKSADIELNNVQASVDTLRTGISGKIAYQDQQAESEHLALKIAEQQMDLKFKAKDLFGDVVKGDFQLSAAQLDLNKILPEQSTSGQLADQTNGQTNGQAAVRTMPTVERQSTAADEIGPFDIPVAMTGTLAVDKLIYKQLLLDKVRADLVLKDNHLKINQLRSGIAGGQLSATSDVNLGVKGLRYQGQMKLEQSQLIALVSGLLPQAKQSVSGQMSWQNNFSGRGTIPDNLLKALQVKGVMQLQKGKIAGSPLLEQLALFLGSPDLKILSFDALESHYDLRDGLANLTGQLDSSKTKLTPQGTIGVDGALNMKLDARLAPELMQKLGAKAELKNAISDQNGWGMLPLVIKGNLSSPKISFDAKALQKQAAEKLKQEATKKLLDKLGPKGGAETEPVKQLLDKTLNRLFGN